MGNKDIDKILAEKVMGWKIKYKDKTLWYVGKDDNFIIICSAWHPTEDEAQALQCWYMLTSKGYRINIHGTSDNTWNIDIYNGHNESDYIIYSVRNIDKFSLALSEAIIKVIGE